MCDRRWDIRLRDIILKTNTIMEAFACVVGEYQKVQVIAFEIIIIPLDFM